MADFYLFLPEKMQSVLIIEGSSESMDELILYKIISPLLLFLYLYFTKAVFKYNSIIYEPISIVHVT